jgi:hypothetical protein
MTQATDFVDNDSHYYPLHIAYTFAQYRMDLVLLPLGVALGVFWGR